MANDITLSSATRSNLLMLRENASMFGATQERLATGRKVNNALDDAMKYFASEVHNRNARELDSVKSEMNEASTLLKITDKAIASAIKVLDQMRGLAKSYASADADNQASIVASINTLSTELGKLLDDASYNGKNILTTATSATAISIRLNTTTAVMDVAGQAADAFLTFTNNPTTGADFAAGGTGLAEIETALSKFKASASEVSSTYSLVSIRLDFTSNLIMNFKDGASMLTEADVNEEGANLLALQTRNQLGVSGLSLASQQAQAVLKLF